MPWEILLLAGLILVISGIACIAMRKHKSSELSNFGPSRTSPPLDTEALAQAIAKAVGAELREILQEMPRQQIAMSRTQDYDMGESSDIVMDESIIPMNIQTNSESSNLDDMAKEEVQVDKRLDKSKSKLQGLFKNKKKG